MTQMTPDSPTWCELRLYRVYRAVDKTTKQQVEEDLHLRLEQDLWMAIYADGFQWRGLIFRQLEEDMKC